MNIVIRMDAYLIQILEKDSFDKFTVSDLKDSYLESVVGKCPVDSRKFVYKQILRLLKFKVVDKKGRMNSHKSIYCKTDLFSKVTFIKKEPKVSPTLPLQKAVEVKNSDINVLSDLNRTLEQYEVDMISAIGESEEYIRLLKSYPEMKPLLNESYHLARDKSSKLLGKIKAINTILLHRDQL